MKPTIYKRSQHIISRKNIDSDALNIIYKLVRSGFKGYLVGGGVRDLLLNKEPKDYDIATNATPKQIKRLFRNSLIIGRRFKLVHLLFKNKKVIQVATFRKENPELIKISEDSPKLFVNDNTFGTEETDAFRRDLTINGLFYNPVNFSIIDYVGGVADIVDKTVRIIGEPNKRFQEESC